MVLAKESPAAHARDARAHSRVEDGAEHEEGEVGRHAEGAPPPLSPLLGSSLDKEVRRPRTVPQGDNGRRRRRADRKEALGEFRELAAEQRAPLDDGDLPLLQVRRPGSVDRDEERLPVSRRRRPLVEGLVVQDPCCLGL